MYSVLVTGGTGFFGRAFVRRLLADGKTQRVCIFSRGEHAQAEMRAEFQDSRMRFFVGDVRDRDRLTRAMAGCDVVVHAAALKRIEVGHYNPDEMVKTNVLGSMNVIEAARDAEVQPQPYPRKVVFLSSDKAFEPVSAYGQSKALAESLFLAANGSRARHGPQFAVTRYGNVAGSTGSVIPRWRQILESSSKVPVTDPEATRFWMRVDDAVDLVLDVIDDMPEEIAIPELPAFRIGDLAQAMGAGMEIQGMNGFEKKHESMCETMCSAWAQRLSVAELREELATV